jgi:transcriptional regulator with XRE-family HTH domain
MTGAVVRRIRGEMGLSQVEFADAIGVHEITVSRWERDVVTVPTPTARLIERLRPPKKATRKGRR